MPHVEDRRCQVALLFALSALLAGCPNPAAPSNPAGATAKTGQPLTLFVVEDPQLGQAIAREWRSRTEEELTVKEITLAELAGAQRLSGDAVIFPSGLLGSIAERGLIQPLDAAALEEPQFDYRDIFSLIRQQEMKWGNRTVAVPLGSPQLLFAYRVDIFEKLGLMPPVNWTDYDALTKRLAERSAAGESAPPDQPWHASIEPLADGWAGQLLLARAASYALHRDQISPLFQFDSAAPLVDQPPYVRALEELAAAAKAGGFAEQRVTPTGAFEELRAGHCAMALSWPAPQATGKSDRAQSGMERIRFALLPGGKQAYRFATKSWEDRGAEEEHHVPLLAIAGRMAAVSSSTSDQKRAQGFVVWLSGREESDTVGTQSAATTLFRTSQVATARRWAGALEADAARQYADVVSQALSLPRGFPGLRLPGRLDYLAALDWAVQQVASGEKPAAAALAEAAARWRAITEKLGVDAQRKANARSLGQELP